MLCVNDPENPSINAINGAYDLWLALMGVGPQAVGRETERLDGEESSVDGLLHESVV
jgi:hypothetical protein